MRKWLNRFWLFIMQTWLIIPIIVAIIVAVALLVPSFSRYPATADDGTPWDRSWEMMGTVLGVEKPESLTLLNNDTILAGDDTYYASWVSGTASEYINADGDTVDLYPAQLYLLLYGCADAESAEEAITDWMGRERETYDILEQHDAAFNSQLYTLLIYNCGSDTNPYSRGISAFSRFGNYVIIAELTCTSDFGGDDQQILTDFLNGCHYSSANLKQ